MRPVRWALLVLLGGCLMQPALAAPHAHPQAAKDRRWKDQFRHLKNYEIVVPHRIDVSGHEYSSSGQSLHRQKRQLPGVSDTVHTEPRSHYLLQAYDRNFTLLLSPESEFLIPVLEVQDFEGNYSSIKNLTETVDPRCFHSGTVKGDQESTVHLSVCNNLMGTIKAFNQIYFIQPHPDTPHSSFKRDNIDLESQVQDQMPHIMFRMCDLHHLSRPFQHCHFHDHRKVKRRRMESMTNDISHESFTFQQSSTYTTSSSHEKSILNQTESSPAFLSNYPASEVKLSLDSNLTAKTSETSFVQSSSFNSVPNVNFTSLGKYSLSSLLSSPHRRKRAAAISSSSGSSSLLSLLYKKALPSSPSNVMSPLSDTVASHLSSLASLSIPAHTKHQHSSRRVRHGRHKKRSLSIPQLPPDTGLHFQHMVRRHVEVHIVVDHTMYDYHGHDLEHYILTLMAVVASIYRDPSIGQPINIVLSKITKLKDEKHGPEISSNAVETLKSFCQWQYENNVPIGHSGHHDTGVLITRKDICRSASKCDTLGLAELGTMCNPKKSCSIIEDNGLSSAFTIAHELGHVFSLPHDDHAVCAPYQKVDEKSEMKAMAGTLDNTMHPWTWSNCSRGYMEDFMDDGHGDCLLNIPGKTMDFSHVKVAGDEYNTDSQCVQVFGDEYIECNHVYPKCQRLWCQSKKDKRCITQHMPWADGSSCGPRMHCRRGECVPEHQPRNPVNGGWNVWTSYSDCSRSCGGGLKVSYRMCDRPKPQSGGDFCTGPNKRFKSCNIQHCPEGEVDFRNSQCEAFNGKFYNIHGLDSTVKWIPKYAGVAVKDQCKLMCRAAGTAAFYTLRMKVIDGTKCSPYTSDMCVNGVCVKAGCDNILKSPLRLDWCGICGGDNTKCTNTSNTYIPSRVNYGYNHVAVLPKGAFNIRIVQESAHNEDENYLALRTTERYLLNGGFSIRLYQDTITLQNGVRLEYSGSQEAVERINSTRPIPEVIYVEVLSVGSLKPPVVRCNFTEYLTSPKEVLGPRARNNQLQRLLQTYHWKYKGWSKCSAVCDGRKKKSAMCVNRVNRRVVHDNYCKEAKPRPRVKRCKAYCRLKWTKSSQGRCSSRCGVGISQIKWRCSKQWVRQQKIKYTSNSHCSVARSQPPDKESCQGQCPPTHWQYKAWSKCSRSCGGGMQEARGQCVDNTGQVWQKQECDENKRSIRRTCNERSCPQWASGQWSKCDCNNGKKTRHIWCLHEGKSISKTFCLLNLEPIRESPCAAKDCTQWTTGEWGKCSVIYGSCMSMRTVSCQSSEGHRLSNLECNMTVKPNQVSKCHPDSCTVTTTTMTHPSSTTLVASTRPVSTTTTSTTTTTTTTTDRVSTSRIQTASMSGATQDETTESANTATDTGARQYWRTGAWSECSSTCGHGTRMRQVHCETDGKIATDVTCGHHPKPASVERCIVQSCGSWRVGEWSPCSRTCDDGMMSRLVACTAADDVNSGEQDMSIVCDYSQRPAHARTCNHGACPQTNNLSTVTTSADNTPADNTPAAQWRVGPWGSCSQSCAGGNRLRRVVCMDGAGETESCDTTQRPADHELCNEDPCPSWRVGGWSTCSATCGEGHRLRIVSCLLLNNKVLDGSMCDPTQRPTSTQDCLLDPCNETTNLRWYKSPWSECSVSCGQGQQKRHVLCIDNQGVQIPDHLCRTAKPRSIKRCKQGKCPAWRATKWSKCSTTCGKGVKRREVKCIGRKKTLVNTSLCQHLEQPQALKPCQRHACGLFRWKADGWSKCSVSCGQTGIRIRQVVCIHIPSQKRVHPGHCPERPRKPQKIYKCTPPSCSINQSNSHYVRRIR